MDVKIASSAGNSPPQAASSFSLIHILQAGTLLMLAAIYSPLSQLILAPVYGSIPSSQFHHIGTATLCLLVLTRPQWFSHAFPVWTANLIPFLAFWIPAVQAFLTRYSSTFGPTFGPLLTEVPTYYLLLFLSLQKTSQLLADVRIDGNVHPALGQTVVGLACYGLFSTLESRAGGLVARLCSMSELVTRVSLQMGIAVVYAAMYTSQLLVFVLPAVSHFLWLNPHTASMWTTQLANRTLHAEQWSLLDRGESVTGYVSVLENIEMGYRVMRCDHSLLGGEWLVTDARRAEGITTPEPVYAVFEMLEAVRLINGPVNEKADCEKNALVIGLGIGTAPKALISHNINTTIIELDPLVYHYATTYFSLPGNHTAILSDAVSYISTAAHSTPIQQYDFILHDVFTGGAEPLSLFTSSFLTNLRSLLTQDGVVAINYAAELSSPLTKTVLYTINTAFDRQCRAFPDRGAEEGTGEFCNIVVFCHNDRENMPLSFRQAVEEDYLGSASRREYLVPKGELEVKLPGEGRVLTEKGIKGWDGVRMESAKRHWEIMRSVVPGIVWENW